MSLLEVTNLAVTKTFKIIEKPQNITNNVNTTITNTTTVLQPNIGRIRALPKFDYTDIGSHS